MIYIPFWLITAICYSNHEIMQNKHKNYFETYFDIWLFNSYVGWCRVSYRLSIIYMNTFIYIANKLRFSEFQEHLMNNLLHGIAIGGYIEIWSKKLFETCFVFIIKILDLQICLYNVMSHLSENISWKFQVDDPTKID